MDVVVLEKLQNIEKQITTYDLLVRVHVMRIKIRSDQAPCKRKGKANKYFSGTLST